MSETTTAPSNIYEKLWAIQSEAPVLQKLGELELGAKKTKFLSIDTVLEKMRPLFNKHRVIVIPTEVEHNLRVQTAQEPPVEKAPEKWSGRLAKTSYSVYVIIDYTFIDVDNPESFVVARVSGESTDAQDKATQKAHTSAFKTLLVKTFMLITGEPELEDQQGINDKLNGATDKLDRGQQMQAGAKAGAATTKKTASTRATPAAAKARQEAPETAEPVATPQPPADETPTPEDAAQPPAQQLQDPFPPDTSDTGLAKAKDRLRAAAQQHNVDRDHVNAIGFRVTKSAAFPDGKDRPAWLQSSRAIEAIAKAIEAGEVE